MKRLPIGAILFDLVLAAINVYGALYLGGGPINWFSAGFCVALALSLVMFQ